MGENWTVEHWKVVSLWRLGKEHKNRTSMHSSTWHKIYKYGIQLICLRSFIHAVGRQIYCPRDASWGMGNVLRTESHYYSILLNTLSVKWQVIFISKMDLWARQPLFKYQPSWFLAVEPWTSQRLRIFISPFPHTISAWGLKEFIYAKHLEHCLAPCPCSRDVHYIETRCQT